MGQPDRRIGCVDALAAVSGSTHHINADVLLRDVNFDVVRDLRHDSHGHGGGVDSSSGLRLRNPLHPVHAALVFHSGVRAPADDLKGTFLKTTETVLIQTDQIRPPSSALRIPDVHAVDLRGKQGGFIPAGSGPKLHNDIFFIIGIPGQQQNLQLFFQPRFPVFCLPQLFFQKFPHFRVFLFFQHLCAFRNRLPVFLPLLIRLRNRLKLRLFLQKLLHLPGIPCRRRIPEHLYNFFQPDLNILQLFKHFLSSLPQPGHYRRDL